MLRLASGLLLAAMVVFAAPVKAAPDDRVVVAQSRPQITVYPRVQPGPNAKRYCESWLATEHRPSGTVLTPQMRCVWR